MYMDHLALLKKLQNSRGDVESAMIVSMDGKLIASSDKAHTPDKDESAFRHCAEAINLALDLVSLIGRGDLDQFYIKGQHGCVILMAIDTTALFVALAKEPANL